LLVVLADKLCWLVSETGCSKQNKKFHHMIGKFESGEAQAYWHPTALLKVGMSDF